jgi:glutaredoxin-like YruB-family protein
MDKKIVIFGTPTCSWCTKVKQYIQSKGFSYKYIDVSRDEKALRDMVSKTGQQGVPQIWIDNYPIVGFDRNKIDQRLNSK